MFRISFYKSALEHAECKDSTCLQFYKEGSESRTRRIDLSAEVSNLVNRMPWAPGALKGLLFLEIHSNWQVLLPWKESFEYFKYWKVIEFITATDVLLYWRHEANVPFAPLDMAREALSIRTMNWIWVSLI